VAVADAACLKSASRFHRTRTYPRIPGGVSVGGLATGCLTRYPLDPPPSASSPVLGHGFTDALRSIRRKGRLSETSARSYALSVAGYLIRWLRSTSHAPLENEPLRMRSPVR